jgi:hypothetical protein
MLTNIRAQVLCLLLGALGLLGCGEKSGSSVPGPDPLSETRPPEDREIQESDLVRLNGDWLFIQNPSTGLNVINVADPDKPRHVGHLDVTGQAGELYVLDDHILIVFETAQPACELADSGLALLISETSEVVAVKSPTSNPEEVARLCFPGTIAASRLVGDVLYVISTYTKFGDSLSWIFSVDLSKPEEMGVVDHMVLDGPAAEVFVNDRAVFVTQFVDEQMLVTGVRYIDISNPDGILRERGGIEVDGAPQGRFHMDATDETFRIVTYSGMWMGTNLFVIDIRDPDHLRKMGEYIGLAPDEELWATRFDGNMAYIVTYLRQTRYPKDPLWTISLADPANPTLLGELEVPGWSNYVFPRGDRLVAVGRGDRGARVAVSLFDVADPRHPSELQRLEFGEPEATSEANTDFRGIRILDEGPFRYRPMIAVPYTNNVWTDGACRPAHFLQLIDLLPDELVLEGVIGQPGTIRRTVPIGKRLYSVSDKTVFALDVTYREQPYTFAVMNIGDENAQEECTWTEDAMDFWTEEEWQDWEDQQGMMMFCATLPGQDPFAGLFSWLALAGVLTVTLRRLRRRTG